MRQARQKSLHPKEQNSIKSHFLWISRRIFRSRLSIPIFMIRQKLIPDRPLFRGHFPFAVNRETGKRFLSRPGETGRTAVRIGYRKPQISACRIDFRGTLYQSVPICKKRSRETAEPSLWDRIQIRICTDKNGGYGVQLKTRLFCFRL